MTDAGASAPVIRIADKGMRAPVEIRGERIGFGTSQRPESLAWATIEIYRLADDGYFTHRAGYSRVYHTADTACRTRNGDQKGDPATVDDLPDDAEPCPRCKPDPPVDLDDGQAVRYEFPRHTFDACDTPEMVVERLTVIRHRDRTKSVRYSQPVKDALRDAAFRDAAFARMGSNGSVHIN
jgi:hypothetical protein